MKTTVMIIAILVTFLMTSCTKEPKLEAWNVYKGEVGNYKVEIDEVLRGGQWTVFVHLDLKKMKGKAFPVAITGHDYDGDGGFERFFIREETVDGYNSVHFDTHGEIVWEPCSADEDKAPPTRNLVNSAVHELYLATAIVYKPGNKNIMYGNYSKHK